MGIEMNDLSLLEITKVKPWAIYFDYATNIICFMVKLMVTNRSRNYMKDNWIRMGIMT